MKKRSKKVKQIPLVRELELLARKLAVGLGEVEIAQPRIRNTPTGESKFHSKVIQSYQRTSMETKRLLTDLYLEGLSSGERLS